MTLNRSQASESLPQWRYLLGRMHLMVKTKDFTSALDLVTAVTAIAEEQQHHPEVDLRYGLVHLAVSSHDAGGITDKDVAFGSAVSALVEQRGLEIVPTQLTEIEIAIDALDTAAVRPFWQAVTGYDLDGDALVDPERIGPSIWFQHLDQPRPQRNTIHVDVTVAHDEAPARLQAAVGAGGRVLSDDMAPNFWVLADAEGNEACLCTWQGRDELDR